MYIPSKILPKLYDALDDHVRKYDCTNIYDSLILEIINDFFCETVNKNCDREFCTVPYEYSVYLDPDLLGGCATVSWIEAGRLYQESFDFSDRDNCGNA